MRGIKNVLKGFLYVSAILLAVLVIFVASDWLLFKRVFTLDRDKIITNVAWFSPLERVEGGALKPLVRASKDNRTIADAAIKKALSYVRTKSSVAFLVWHQGALQIEWYGDGYDPTTITESASMHKSVLALLIGLAIESGIVGSVDEPAATYIPGWANDVRANITIRNLLQMASGLSRPPRSFNPLSDSMRLTLAIDLAETSLKYPAEDFPGSVFSYNNINSQILGMIIENASGQRYAEFLQEKLWSKVAEHHAAVFLDSPNGLARTSGTLLTTAESWLRIGLLHLNKGRVEGEQVVPESWIDAVTTPSNTNPNYGYHTWLGTEFVEKRDYGKGVLSYVPHSEPFAAEDIIFFDGFGGQRVYVIPSRDLVIVRTGPGEVDFSTGANVWDDSLLPNTIIGGLITDG